MNVNVGVTDAEIDALVAACVQEPPFPTSWYDDDPTWGWPRDAVEEFDRRRDAALDASEAGRRRRCC